MNRGMVSIIVPVYNAEKYIDRCIKSIVNQIYTNIEIILIDDESPDKCPEICDSWAKIDNRILVVHKKNEGVSCARNDGMKISNGEFISFVDSDDYIEDDYIQRFMDKIDDKTDVVRAVTSLEDGEMYTHSEEFLHFFYNSGEINPPWKQLIRRDFLEKNNIKFDEKITFGEDTLFSIEILLKSCKFKHIRYNGYVYCKNPDSITRARDKYKKLRNIYDLSVAYSSIYNLFDDVFKRYNTNRFFCELNRYILEMSDCCNVSYNDFSGTIKKVYENLMGSIFYNFDNSIKEVRYSRFENFFMKLLKKKKINTYFLFLVIRKITKKYEHVRR